jgi:hypothetical protein
VNVFSEQGWLAEGEISYAGARAEAVRGSPRSAARAGCSRSARCAST